MGLGVEVSASDAVPPPVAKKQTIVEVHLQAVWAGAIGNHDPLHANDSLRVSARHQVPGVPDDAIERPPVPRYGRPLSTHLRELATGDVVRAQEVGRVEARRVGIDVAGRALLDDAAVLEQQDVVRGRERLASGRA